MAVSAATRRLGAVASAALALAACASTPPAPVSPALGDRLYAGRPLASYATERPAANGVEARQRAAEAGARGDHDMMMYFLVKAAELDPADSDALLLIGAAHEDRANLAQARLAYELGLARTPERRELVERLGLVCVQLGLDDRARALLEPLAVFGDARWQVYDAIGILDDRAGRHDAAQAEYDLALERQPKSAATLNNRGYSRLLGGDLAGAERDFRAAITIGSFDRVWANLGAVEALQGRYADALASYLRALPKAESLSRVGESALARGDYGVARELLLQALEASPTWLERAHAGLEVAEAHLSLPVARR